jgi:hypothetical protein
MYFNVFCKKKCFVAERICFASKNNISRYLLFLTFPLFCAICGNFPGLNSYCLIVSTQLRNQNGIILLKSEFRGAARQDNAQIGANQSIASGDELSILDGNGTRPSVRK